MRNALPMQQGQARSRFGRATNNGTPCDENCFPCPALFPALFARTASAKKRVLEVGRSTWTDRRRCTDLNLRSRKRHGLEDWRTLGRGNGQTAGLKHQHPAGWSQYGRNRRCVGITSRAPTRVSRPLTPRVERFADEVLSIEARRASSGECECTRWTLRASSAAT